MSSSDESLRKGQWFLEEDECLRASVAHLGECRWDAIARATGLKRSGKSCRLRWLNYLRPDLKHSPISGEEEEIILRLHQKWGNKWARIARRLPGRTDNEIKNYWRGCLRKKTAQLLDQSEGCTSNKVSTLQGNSVSPWNIGDDDETDYNDDIKEIPFQEDEVNSSIADDCELVSSSSGELPHVLMNIPKSPYESHFSNWVSLFPDQNNCNGSFERDVGMELVDCWDWLWDMDLFPSNN